MQKFILNPGFFTYPARLVFQETNNNAKDYDSMDPIELSMQAEVGNTQALQTLANKASNNLQELLTELGNKDDKINQAIKNKMDDKINQYVNNTDYIDENKINDEYKNFVQDLLTLTNQDSNNLDKFIDTGLKDFTGDYDINNQEKILTLVDMIMTGKDLSEISSEEFLNEEIAKLEIGPLKGENCTQINLGTRILSNEAIDKIIGSNGNIEITIPKSLENIIGNTLNVPTWQSTKQEELKMSLNNITINYV